MKRTLAGPAYRTSRRSLLKKAVAGGAGLAGVSGIVGAGVYLSQSGHKTAAHAAGYQYNGDSIQNILNMLSTAKAAGVAFYTQALNNAHMLGWNHDMRNHVQAILVEEQIHVLFLQLQGGRPHTTKFSFPHGMKSVQHASKFLDTQQMLESILMSAHLAAIKEFGQMGRGDMAQMIGQMMGVDAEHRAWGRWMGNMMPMTNLVFEQVTIVEVVEVIVVLQKNGFMTPTNGNTFWYHPTNTVMGMNMNGMNMQNMQNMQITPNMQMMTPQPPHF
ncbi:MAG TPA: ferritin-like domain-containing protein [Ktedonobacteraceae bacterium]|jgi:hypothetical protein|nr:ferritin-like domain-containing protein [Ktedonobacteraceae bacterium]